MRKRRNIEYRDDLKEVLVETPMEDITLQASKIMPELPVKLKADTFNVLPAGVGHKLSDDTRTELSGYDRTTYSKATDSYITKAHGTEELIDIMEGDISFDEEVVASLMSRNRLLLNREKRVADTVFDTTVFTGIEYTDTVSDSWDDASADFRSDIRDAGAAIRKRLKLGLSSLSLILTEDRVLDMLNTLAAKESIKYTEGLDLRDLTYRLNALATYIGVKEIVQVNGMADLAGLGLKANFDFLYPNNMAMLAKLSPSVASWKMGGLGRQPVYTPVASDYVVEEYEVFENDYMAYRVKDYRGQKLFKDYGYLIKGIA